MSANSTMSVQVGGQGGVPTDDIAALVVNIGAIDATDSGWLKTYAWGDAVPSGTSLVYGPGGITSNVAIVPVDANGRIALSSSAPLDVTLDVVGYYTKASDSNTWNYTYAPDGIRSTKSGPDVDVSYQWDRSSPLPMLLSQTDENVGTTYFIYGPGGLPIEQINADNSVYFLHHDQIGSTRMITNAAGNRVATFSYDAYGNERARSSNASSPFGFAGQYSDAESGYQYLRARFYDPTTGSFLTRDPIEAVTRSPYGYVSGDPLNRTDPSGLWDIPGTDWCIDTGDDCNSIAEQNPEVTQGVVDFASGVLDVNPITATTNALGLSDTGQYANECSGWYRGGQASMIAAELAMGAGAGRSLFSRQGLEIGASRQIGRSGSRGAWFVRAHFDDAAHRMGDGRLIGPHLQVNRWVSGVSGPPKGWYWELPGWFPWP